MTHARRRVGLAGASLAMAIVAALPLAGSIGGGTRNGEWRHYSGDNAATKYSPLDQITKENVTRLRIAWRRPHVSPAFAAENASLRLTNNFRSTPIYANGVLYASNGVGLAEAVDPATGQTLWTQAGGLEPGGTAANRGLAYWGEGAEARIITHRGSNLYALNPKTGEPIASFGEGGRVDLNVGMGPLAGRYNWTGAPLVTRDVIVMGSSMVNQDSATRMEGEPGTVRAYDARTGRLRWAFRPIPREGEFGVNTWENESWAYTGAGNVWTLMSADDDLGYVYLPTSSVTNDMYGGHRLGNNLFSSSIVCIDAATGRRVWHYQTVHHDLFDYDNPAAPILVDITVNGRAIKAVAVVTKQSFVFVLDRVTGEPVWPIEERPVPASTVPGERASATQPFPTRPPAFDRQGITDDDLIDFTPELKAKARALISQYITGPMFTPPSVVGTNPGATQGTIQLPGSVGGADWTGAGFDHETGVLYVPSMTNPFVANLLPGDPAQTNLRYRASTRALIQLPEGLPLLKPPYGRITAIDLNRGDHLWMVPNGDGPRRHPLIQHLNLPPLGHAVRAAPLVTRTVLFMTEGDQINARTPPGGGGRKFRALDKATGATLWEVELEAGATGAPMTYLHNGRQYVVFAIGSQQHPAEFVAFAL